MVTRVASVITSTLHFSCSKVARKTFTSWALPFRNSFLLSNRSWLKIYTRAGLSLFLVRLDFEIPRLVEIVPWASWDCATAVTFGLVPPDDPRLMKGLGVAVELSGLSTCLGADLKMLEMEDTDDDGLGGLVMELALELDVELVVFGVLMLGDVQVMAMLGF